MSDEPELFEDARPDEPFVPSWKRAKAEHDDDPRPFVERYRGTPYDVTPQPEPSAPAGKRRITLSTPVLLGIGLVVIAVVVTVALTFLGNRRDPMAAFRQATPRPTPLSTPAVGQPSPGMSATIQLSTPAPTPAWAADSQHPAALFIAAMKAPDLRYHLDAGVTLRAQGEEATMSYTLDANAHDYSIDLDFRSSSGRLTVEVVVVDGRYWGRVNDDAWVNGSGAPPPSNPFGTLTDESFAKLVYVGQESVGGKLLHHLRLPVTRWPAPLDRAVAVVRAPSVLTWDVWVDSAGRPRSARITFDVTVRVQAEDTTMTLNFDYAISKFGKDVTITKPAP